MLFAYQYFSRIVCIASWASVSGLMALLVLWIFIHSFISCGLLIQTAPAALALRSSCLLLWLAHSLYQIKSKSNFICSKHVTFKCSKW